MFQCATLMWLVQIESVREPCVQALDDTAAYLFG